MANWHIITGDNDANSFRVVYHIPIPDENNSANPALRLRAVLISSGVGGKTMLTPGNGQDGTISTTEKNQIEGGERFEIVETVNTNPLEALADLTTKINARFAILSTDKLAQLRKNLKYYGHAPV